MASFYRSYWAGQAGHRLIFDLRYALYQHIQSMSHSFFDARRSGAIVARFVSDIQLAKFTPMQSRSLLEKVAANYRGALLAIAD